MVRFLLRAFFKNDTFKSCAIDQNAGSEKSVTLQSARRAKKGIGDFPKTEKRQKSNCGIPANRLVALFIYACVATRATLARE